MGKFTFDDVRRIEEENLRAIHRNLIQKTGEEKAIRTIKKQIPKGYKLKEYMDELKADIELRK